MSFNEFLQNISKPYSQNAEAVQSTLEDFSSLIEDKVKVEKYKIAISQAISFKEKYILSIRLVAFLTGDKKFYDTNIKILEVSHENRR